MTPDEWAAWFRREAVALHVRALSEGLTERDCRELADRMDDLAEALRLLRAAAVLWPSDGSENQWVHDARALLTKYASKEG